LNAETCWTGAPATAEQALPWPRIGMVDRNGNPIPEDEIPNSLKDMENELAALMMQRDRTAETDAQVQGLKSLKAGSVALEFVEGATFPSAVPETVKNLGVPSWFCPTDEEALNEYVFQVL
jgi:hypothetical protein